MSVSKVHLRVLSSYLIVEVGEFGVSVSDTEKIFEEVNNNQATGPDNIPPLVSIDYSHQSSRRYWSLTRSLARSLFANCRFRLEGEEYWTDAVILWRADRCDCVGELLRKMY